jgi:flagellar motility protein MotE (MotC chaperone)
MRPLHEHLTPDEIAHLMTEGASLTPEAAIAHALTLETSARTLGDITASMSPRKIAGKPTMSKLSEQLFSPMDLKIRWIH